MTCIPVFIIMISDSYVEMLFFFLKINFCKKIIKIIIIKVMWYVTLLRWKETSWIRIWTSGGGAELESLEWKTMKTMKKNLISLCVCRKRLRR